MDSHIPPLIALEEHFLSADYVSSESCRSLYGDHISRNPTLTTKLGDLAEARISDMTSNGISLQVVSHAPGLRTIEQCQAANNQLHAATLEHSDRFAGFAVLPVDDPNDCAYELRRCVQELSFKGALIDNHTGDGKAFTASAYDTMWRVFEELDVPCYIHPTCPTDSQMKANFEEDGIPASAIPGLSTSTWGWHADTGLHIIKLFAAGVFDRFPKLKIIIGHFGEMLPFMLERVDLFNKRWKKTGRTFLEVWKENIWITTSGVWSVNPLATILRNTAIDHVLFSVDYPFAPNENGKRWMEELIKSDLVDEEGVRKIAYGNAVNLLRMEGTFAR